MVRTVPYVLFSLVSLAEQRGSFSCGDPQNAAADSRGKSLVKLPLQQTSIKQNKKIYITDDKSKLKVRLACCHSLPFIFRKQTAVIIDLMVQLEWKHFWA